MCKASEPPKVGAGRVVGLRCRMLSVHCERFCPRSAASCAKRPAASDLAGLREAVVLGVVQIAGSLANPVLHGRDLQLDESAKPKGRVEFVGDAACTVTPCRTATLCQIAQDAVRINLRQQPGVLWCLFWSTWIDPCLAARHLTSNLLPDPLTKKSCLGAHCPVV